MPWCAGDTATGVRARTAHIKPRDRRPVVAMPQHRTCGIQLVERHVAVEDIAADQPEFALEIERRMDLPCNDTRLEIGCMLRDGVDDVVGDLLADIVP